MQLIATSFTGMQLALVLVVSFMCAALLASNGVLLYIFFKKRAKRKLCTAALQNRREQLLEELYGLRTNPPAASVRSEQPQPQTAAESTAADADTEDEEESEEVVVDIAERGEKILAVRNMSDLMRAKFGFTGDEYALKQYYVRNTYGFEAKLRASDDVVKERYIEVSNEIRKFDGLNVKRSFKAERVYSGRTTLAAFVFRGKTLCLALALSPDAYAETKYRGEDVSNVKRFAATPMLLRLTSARRVEYAKHLVEEMALAFSLTAGVETYRGIYDLTPRSYSKLFAMGLLKIKIVGSAPDIEAELFDDEYEEENSAAATAARARAVRVADMSRYMRLRLGLVGTEYDRKSYYLRYTYTFEAKLRLSADEVKQRYTEFITETGWYKKLNLIFGNKGVRICYGRATVAQLLFRGKTLCVAFALNPNDFADTKYRGLDVGNIKRFASTPFLFKLTSLRRLGYAKYLLNRLAEQFTMEMNQEPISREFDLAPIEHDKMLELGLLKIAVAGEVPDEVAEPKPAAPAWGWAR